MRKRLLSAVLLACMVPTFGFAEMIPIVDSSTVEANPQYDKNNVMNILNNITKDVSTDIIDSTKVDLGGTVDQGKQGVSLALGYLTPKKELGYMYLDDYGYPFNWTGKTTRVYDDAGLNIGSGILNKSTTGPVIYENMKNTFKTNAFKNTLASITKDDLDNVLIQTDNDGREFISSSMFVRWMYDTDSKISGRGNAYVDSHPVLSNTGLNNGPYISMGDNFDGMVYTGDIVAQNGEKYAKTLTSITGDNYSGVKYLTQDRVLNDIHPQFRQWIPTNKAMLQKRCEYRRYVSRGDGIDGLGDYEYVYPVTETVVTSQNSTASQGLVNSIKSETIYSDANKTSVEKYVFDIKSNPLKAERDYPKSEKTYEYSTKKGAEERDPSIGVEPNENSADKWHKINKRTFYIKDINNNVIYKKEIDSTYPDNFKLTVTPQDVGGKTLIGCRAELETHYDTFARYMNYKEVISNKYVLNGATGSHKTYEEIQQYIKDKVDSSADMKLDITKLVTYEETTKPRVIKKFKTAEKLNQVSSIQSSIEIADKGDPIAPTPVLTIDPPNALTKLEGGKFDINIKLDGNNFAIEDSGKDVWLSDIKIDPLVVTAQNGETIYTHPEPITDFSNKKLEFSIKAVTANPSHIGKATVNATYSYIVNTKEWVTKEVTDKDGNTTIVREDSGVKQTHHSGEIVAHFNIYSLSGVTS
ncbi:hypothetical protein ACSW8S_18320 (plasmid) [Clostridium perfringens]